MKSKTLLLAAFFILCQVAAAQTHFGIRGGLNVNDIRIQENNYSDWGMSFEKSLGFHGGIFLEKFIGKRVSVQPELIFQLKGSQTRQNEDLLILSDYKTNFYYLSLPLLVRIHFGNLALEAGPEFSYRTGGGFASDDNVFFETIYDNEFDAGIAGGIGYSFGRFRAGIRYIHGLSNLAPGLQYTDHNGVPLDERPHLFNRSFQVSVGYALFGRR
jgi:hypothetical protein